MTLRLLCFFLCFALFYIKPAFAEQKYSIYLDADFSSAKASSVSILQGINTALAEVNYQIQGHTFDIIVKDHLRNPVISRDNLSSYLKDPNALVVFSGLHSPPLISNKSYINNNKILLLDPWAAAEPITRSNNGQNWIFRLSIDDKKAGAFIVNAVVKKGFNKPYLVLEDTAWGRQNYDKINQALNGEGIKASGVSWFDWNIQLQEASALVKKINRANPDMILFIGNASEAKTIAQAVLTMKKQFEFPIYSHWGVTGGDFFEFISKAQDHSLSLTFIQTKFAFTNPDLTVAAKRVLANAITYNKEINSRQDIKAPTGFIHAYDLTKLLISAINQAGLTGDRDIDKQAIHQALEHLNKPVHGLIKTYDKPFSPYDKNTPDAHEALDSGDYALGQYDSNGEIRIINN